MLSLGREHFTGELRLYIRCERGEAWIAQIPRTNPEQKINWAIWVRPRAGAAARTSKSPLRLAIESQLRAWLLRRYQRCLRTLNFAELRSIAEMGTRPPNLTQGKRRAT
jgi:hypothetical protein